MSKTDQKIYVGQTLNINFTVRDEDNIAVDLSNPAVINFVLRRVNGSKKTVTGLPTTDGTDGKVYYQTTADDLDIAGNWKVQGIITIGLHTYPTDIHDFKVLPRL